MGVLVRRLAALVASACVATVLVPAVAAASPSKPPPMLTVTGRILAPDGRPQPRATVYLHEPMSIFDVFVGMTCLFAILPALVAPDACFPQSTYAMTDAAGRYTLRFGKNSRLAREDVHLLEVTGIRPPGALGDPEIYARYPFRGVSRGVADLQVWTGNLSATPDAAPGLTRLHADPLPARYSEQRTAPVGELRSRSGVTFTVGTVDGDRRVDSRLLEHGTDRFAAYAAGTTGDVRAILHAAPVGLRHTGAPPSRGKGCWTYDTSDRPLRFPGCHFTDGRLAEDPGFHYALAGNRACRFSGQCANPALLVVDLGATTLVDFVVERGCDGDCPLEASVDGTSWVPLRTLGATGGGDTVAFDVVPTPARYVRMSYDDIFVWDFRELSVFGRPLPVAPPAPVRQPVPAPPAAGPAAPPPAVTDLVTVPDLLPAASLRLP